MNATKRTHFRTDGRQTAVIASDTISIPATVPSGYAREALRQADRSNGTPVLKSTLTIKLETAR